MEIVDRRWREYVPFAAVSVVFGPLLFLLNPLVSTAFHWQAWIGDAVPSGFAGAVLVLLSLAMRKRQPRGREWAGLGVLLVPQIIPGLFSLPVVHRAPWMHEIGWGDLLLVDAAAPLWLALLAALQFVRPEQPRAIAGAGIAGLAAICLAVPVDTYSVSSGQVAPLVAHLLMALLAVFCWALAYDRLRSVNAIAAAGHFLLLRFAGDAAVSISLEGKAWSTMDWFSMPQPILAQATLLGIGTIFWFVLLRAGLRPIVMLALGQWVASGILGLAVFGIKQWRTDVAIAIALGAIIVALEAHLSEEQPTTLGLTTDGGYTSA